MDDELPHVDVVVPTTTTSRGKKHQQTNCVAMVGRSAIKQIEIKWLTLAQLRPMWLEKRMTEPIGRARGMPADIYPEADPDEYLRYLHNWYRGGRSTGEYFSTAHLPVDCPFHGLAIPSLPGHLDYTQISRDEPPNLFEET